MDPLNGSVRSLQNSGKLHVTYHLHQHSVTVHLDHRAYLYVPFSSDLCNVNET
jgi:hypothetical protein